MAFFVIKMLLHWPCNEVANSAWSHSAVNIVTSSLSLSFFIYLSSTYLEKENIDMEEQ